MLGIRKCEILSKFVITFQRIIVKRNQLHTKTQQVVLHNLENANYYSIWYHYRDIDMSKVNRE